MTARVLPTADDALEGVADGSVIMFGGFVSAGSPSNLILALQRRGTTGITAIANNIGLGDRLDELCDGSSDREGSSDLRHSRLRRPQ